MNTEEKNPLASASVGSLMLKYALPSVIALVVNALYNIVDQIFIGWGVGTLGNSATNVIFPLNMVVTALALLLGDGGAAHLSLELGRDEKKNAEKGANNTFSWLILVGILMFVVCAVFLKPMTAWLGATQDNLPYALAYGRIIVIGFPFVIVGCGMCSLIRADGTPHLTMISMIVGCVANVILDAVFVLGFGWGMEGAAIATVIGQILTFALSMWYVPRFKTVKLSLYKMKPELRMLKRIASLGVSSFISQFAVAVVIAVVNACLVRYGTASEYGPDIPLAAFGIVMKFNTILVAVVTGIGTGAQPIVGYNYGRADYGRVKDTFLFAIKIATGFAILCFAIFQLFPHQLTAIFGEQGTLYTAFSIKSFRIFTLLCFFNGFQIVSAIFFQSIGKPVVSAVISFSRQIIILIPAMFLLCRLLGLDGVLWAGPVADGLSFLLALALILGELKKLHPSNAAAGNEVPVRRRLRSRKQQDGTPEPRRYTAQEKGTQYEKNHHHRA